MNERIKELAEQARKHFPATEHSGEFWVFDEGKFAELLEKEFESKHFSEGYLHGQSDGIKQTVRQCIELADQYGSGGAGSEFDVGYCSCANTLSDEFKKRFGVEE